MSFAFGGRSMDLRLDDASAYSIAPGRVHVEGLTMRGRDQTSEWAFGLDHADVAISLLDLIHRRFHATRVRASGFALRGRMRLDHANPSALVLSALPPIPGFADPPFLDDGPAPPALADADYEMWMVDLEDVVVEHVREVWFHTVRAEGDMRVRGRWLFRPPRRLDVGPATVDVTDVDISFGSHPLATGIHGSIGATIYPFDPRSANGLEIFDNLSSSGELRGRAILAGFFQLMAPKSAACRRSTTSLR